MLSEQFCHELNHTGFQRAFLQQRIVLRQHHLPPTVSNVFYGGGLFHFALSIEIEIHQLPTSSCYFEKMRKLLQLFSNVLQFCYRSRVLLFCALAHDGVILFVWVRSDGLQK